MEKLEYSFEMKNEEEMADFVERLLSYIVETSVYRAEKNKAQVVTLSGDLGAGKTTCVQYLARALGVTQTVTSPTFVIMKEYDLEHEHFDRLVHIDAYRLEKPEDSNAVGLESLMQDTRNLIAIEWPERLASNDGDSNGGSIFENETVVALHLEILPNTYHRITTNAALYE